MLDYLRVLNTFFASINFQVTVNKLDSAAISLHLLTRSVTKQCVMDIGATFDHYHNSVVCSIRGYISVLNENVQSSSVAGHQFETPPKSSFIRKSLVRYVWSMEEISTWVTRER
jgi:hypothetical protein